jgi:hypothetical protein
MKSQIILKLALGLASSALILLGTTAGAETAPACNQKGLVGVWQVVRHGVDCNTGIDLNTFPALMSFHSDGTISSQAVAPGSTNAFGAEEFGVWQSLGNHNYSFHFVSYGYDDSGVLAGSVQATGSLQLTSATTFTYSATISFYDANGSLLFSVCGRADGTRFQ